MYENRQSATGHAGAGAPSIDLSQNQDWELDAEQIAALNEDANWIVSHLRDIVGDMYEIGGYVDEHPQTGGYVFVLQGFVPQAGQFFMPVQISEAMASPEMDTIEDGETIGTVNPGPLGHEKATQIVYTAAAVVVQTEMQTGAETVPQAM
ncbi:hypothetical protein [Salinibaculum rarum]|uniref:hypothetical protein n=1 Tax=Salinibaculum rarum TaxID=3058903 RepID=UPI00265DDCCB|nr:hypothetical protein [Salinibaculum sp. KK48]